MTTTTNPVLVLGDGNAFAILGAAQQVLRKIGRKDDWNAIYAEATAGDYDHLLRTMMKHFDVRLESDSDSDFDSCGDCGATLDTYDKEWVDGDWYCLGCQPEEDED